MEKRVTKSNALINSSYRLSLNELRIVLYGLSHIDPHIDDFPLDYKINIRELAEFYNIGDKDRGSFYDDIKNALVTKFWEREFSYFDQELDRVVKKRWLIEVQYGGKDGILAYSYNPKLKDQLQKLSRNFTSYFLNNIANMKSSYAVRLYEILIMYLNSSRQDKTVTVISIVDLKQKLDIADKYKRFYHMRAKVIEIARRDINRHSDIRFNYRVIKAGRTPKKIEFTITRKGKDSAYPSQTTALPPVVKSTARVPSKLATLKPECLTPAIFEKAKRIVAKAGDKWDLYAIEQQFYEYVKKKGPPESLEGAFLGFVRKKVQSPP